jgi:Flp pilus assembly pilin Flp
VLAQSQDCRSHGNLKEGLAGDKFVPDTNVGTGPVMPTELQFILDMLLNYFIKTTEALKRLRADTDGVVSFEYIIVATFIVIIVIAVYSGAGGNSISGALSSGLAKIAAAMNTL